jgi:hypothetical protein
MITINHKLNRSETFSLHEIIIIIIIIIKNSLFIYLLNSTAICNYSQNEYKTTAAIRKTQGQKKNKYIELDKVINI